MTQQTRPMHFGSGWISGTLGVVLGAVGLFAVVCLHFPNLLTMPQLREAYDQHLPLVRGAIHVFLLAGFLLGLMSLYLRQNKTLGIVAMALPMIAALSGGSQTPLGDTQAKSYYFALDWFLLSVILYSIVFIPMERAFARLPDQRTFRRHWRTDLFYFFLSAFLVQATTWITLKPAMVFFSWASSPSLQASVKALPGIVQFLLIVVCVDLVQYWVHRMFHVIPLLWRFHAVHHSADAMDWLAGSRTHFIDMLFTRAATFIPAYILGFDEKVMFIYLIFISFQATLIHSNVRFNFRAMRFVLTTPQFHHWHHGTEREAWDKNFAVHLPILDKIFGTFYLPGDKWPSSYGLTPNPVPRGFFKQIFYPFLGGAKTE